MLNTTSTMAFSDHLSYMTPTRSSARTGVRRPLTMTGRDCAGDYFASSADFEYDLFLHGLVTCDSGALASSSGRGGSSAANVSTSASSSFSASGFFSRYRASRPVSTASPTSNGSRQQQQQQHQRSNQSLLTALSITSLNRSSAYEQPYNSYSYHQPSDDSNYYRSSAFGGGFGEQQQLHHQQQTGICSQQHRMKNMLASNLSLGSSVNTVAAASFRPNLLEEHQRNQEKQTALKQSGDSQLDPSSVNVDNLSHQQLHALHRFRRQKKKGFLSRLRDVVISFTPKARMSIVNRPDLFVRFGLQEKDALACFDYLDKMPLSGEGGGDHTSDTTGPEDVAVSETLVTIDDLLAEWKLMEEAKEKQCSGVDATVPTITATSVPPLSCDTTLATPLATSTAAGIKQESVGCLTMAADESVEDYGASTLVIDQAADSCSSSIAGDHRSLDDNGPPSSSVTPLCDGSVSVSVARANSGGKASKKKSKQKKAKVGKFR